MRGQGRRGKRNARAAVVFVRRRILAWYWRKLAVLFLALEAAECAIHLPRIVEEEEAVLDTRAAGAETAERVAIACMIARVREKAQMGVKLRPKEKVRGRFFFFFYSFLAELVSEKTTISSHSLLVPRDVQCYKLGAG